MVRVARGVGYGGGRVVEEGRWGRKGGGGVGKKVGGEGGEGSEGTGKGRM